MTADLLQYKIRRCCSGGPRSHRLLAEATTPPRNTMPNDWTGEIVEVVELPEPPRWEHIAYHEAGHAVVSIALGGRVQHAQIDGAPLVQSAPGLSWRAQAIVLEAGEIAENWRVEWHDSPRDGELQEHVEAIRELSIGKCDRCRLFLQLVSSVGLDAPIAAHLKCYRDLEGEAVRAVRRPDIWNAIEALAAELMRHGVLSGGRVHEIVEHYVRPGSLTIGA